MTRRARSRAVLLACIVLTGACHGGDDHESRETSASTDRATTSTTSASGPSTSAAPLPPRREPAWRGDFPDPFVLVDGDRYYAYATESGLIRIQHLAGDASGHWTDLGDALQATPPWATPYSTWAPAVLRRGNRYVLFYSALVAGTGRHCIGRAIASDPVGPFVDETSEPFLCPMDLGGAIDPSPFVDEDGSVYLLWKNDGITLRRDAALWALPLRDDAGAAAGASVRLVGTDQRWEYPHVEGPSMVHVGSDYWLAYSGNWWNQAAYGIGLARCKSPVGPCTKPFDAPVLSSRPGAYGPGGLEFFRGPKGQLLAAWHAWLDKPGYPGQRGDVDLCGRHLRSGAGDLLRALTAQTEAPASVK